MDYNSFLRKDSFRPFFENTVALLFEVYQNAHEATLEEFPSQLVPTRCGMERYFMLERDWPMLAKKHGFAISFQPNANGGWNHVEIGNTDIVLTQKKVRHPEELVPKAIFRETLAEANGEQLTLFPEGQQVRSAILRPEGRIFIMLLHGYAHGRRDRPGFAHLVVPSHGCTEYLARLDLLAYCRARTLEAGSETEVIVPTSGPIIKKKAIEGNNA